MSEQKQGTVQRFVMALAALRRLVSERGYDNDLTADEIWRYAEGGGVPSEFRSYLTTYLLKADYLERTPNRVHARSSSRRSNLVDSLKPGSRLKRDKLTPILFYCVTAKNRQLPSYAIQPCMSLTPLGHRAEDISSNDKYKTAFELHYHPADTDAFIVIGIVKILQMKEGKVQQTTSLPDIFAVLDSRFVSLGQDIDYYKKLEDLGEAIYEPVFSGLNDVVFHQDIEIPFRANPAWQSSLLRFSEAEKAYREARNLFYSTPIDSEPPSETFAFTFTCQVPGAVAPHKISFDFRKDDTKLNRIAALIGRNGTGKTQVLAQFAHAVSGLKLEMGHFDPKRPSFSKVIAISYSIFDEFERPAEDETTFSYIYCGIRQKERLLKQNEIRKKLFEAIQAIKATERYVRWKEIILPLLDGIPLPGGNLGLEDYRDFYDKLSSGQRILLLVMSEVIQNIAEESIILFDEPELHLHPEAIATLTRSLHKLLDQFKSYAIIATHSPIILQEIPAKFVTVFKRQGHYPIVSPLQFESFGENLSNITDEVFETTEERYNYRDHLRELAKDRTYKDVLGIFDNRLSFNARAFLGTLYREH